MDKIVKLLLAVTLLSGINREDATQPLGSEMIKLSGHSSIAQTFTAGSDNLNSVSICLRNPDRVTDNLEFALYEATSSAKPLVSQEFSAGIVPVADCTEFNFPEIAGSAGKSYVAQITPPDITDKKIANIYLEADKKGIYSGGSAFVDQVAVDTDLHFRTTYHQSLRQSLAEAGGQFLTRLGKDWGFTLVYIFMILAIFYRWRKTPYEK